MNRALLLVLLASLFPFSALAQVLALSPEISPYVVSVDGRTASGGQAFDMVNEAARRAGLNVRIEIQPWARAYATASRTKDLLLLPVFRTPEREALFEWIGPINRAEYKLFRLKAGAAKSIRNLDQLGTATIGVLNKDAIHRSLEAKRPAPRLEPVPEYQNLIQMFLGGRFEYLAVVPLGLYDELGRLGLPKSTVEPLFVVEYSEDPYAYLVAAKGSNPALIEPLSKALASMQKDGTWEAIFHKYE